MALVRTLSTALALALALAACKPQQGEPAAGATPPAATAAAPAQAAPRCPDTDFDSFLKRFGAEIAVQEKATADPLTMLHVDANAEPEPKPVRREVPLAEVTWPVIPNLEAARANGREVVVSKTAEGREVLVRTPNTGDQQVYFFAQRPCWTLVKVDDQAL